MGKRFALKRPLFMRLDVFNILSALVVAVWLGMAGLLMQRAGPPVEPRGAGVQLSEKDAWMGVYLEGKKAGYAHQSVTDTPEGYRLSEEFAITLTVMDTRQAMRSGTVSYADKNLDLKSFDFSLASGVAEMTIKGEVKGGVLSLDVDTAGRKRKMDVPLAGPVHMASGLELVLGRKGYEPGTSFSIPIFDPSSLSVQRVEVYVEGREELKLGERVIPVYRVRQKFADVVVRSWISPELGTVKADGLMGFTFLMETKEQAMKPPEGGYGSADIIALASVDANGSLPDPRHASYMKVKLKGADLKGLDLSGGRQSVDGRVVSISVEDTDGLAAVKLPVTDESFAEYLKPDAFVQADDPKIIAKAREVVHGEKDARKAARMLSDWVYKHMEKRPSAGIPSAVEVLSNLQGDCNEHTVLFTALARSAGIPARMAAGLVMMDGRFYYHAWPEVYVGKWVAVDPAFGQFPADATHVRLVLGGPDKQIAILKLVGNLKIDIIEGG